MLPGGVQPLLALRTQQGYTPRFVDAQRFSSMSTATATVGAPAIRNFRVILQRLAEPQSHDFGLVVGDGTYDPFNYKNTAFGSDVTHPIPPYMLNVHIYINGAPAERIAQLKLKTT